MGTLIRMKAEVTNHELPVLTEQGILPYYTGMYVNKLAEKGVTLTQSEINAVTALINSLIEADVIDKIGTFYPYLGNPNVPLIGSKEYGYTDVTSANEALDFVNGKLRGYKKLINISGVKLSDLCVTDFGAMWGGTMISKVPTNNSATVNNIVYFRESASSYLQLRLSYSDSEYKFRYFDKTDGNSNLISYTPPINTSDDLHNFSFAYGAPSAPAMINRTLYRDDVKLSNVADESVLYIHNTNIANMYPTQSNNQSDWVVTTLAFFNEILTAAESDAFCQAVNTFAAAVGKTVSVG